MDRLDAQRVRCHIHENRLDRLAVDDGRLDRCAQGHGLVGVDLGAGLRPEVGGEHLAHQGNARRASDQKHLAQLLRAQAGVLQGAVDRFERGAHQRTNEVLELGA